MNKSFKILAISLLLIPAINAQMTWTDRAKQVATNFGAGFLAGAFIGTASSLTNKFVPAIGKTLVSKDTNLASCRAYPLLASILATRPLGTKINLLTQKDTLSNFELFLQGAGSIAGITAYCCACR